MSKNNFFKLTLAILLVWTSCKLDERNNDSTVLGHKSYLHLSHTRQHINTLIDEDAKKIDFDKYDMLWLGGDLTDSTSVDLETMAHVDEIFDVKSKNVLWALGNHDYDNLENIKRYTKRNSYYTMTKDNITYIVLDNQSNKCNIIGDQRELLLNVLDTIKESSHLLLLHHKLFWMYGNDSLQDSIPYVSNGMLGDCSYCLNPNSFYEDIYHKLVAVQEKGIEVICIAGDIGRRTTKFEYKTPEGIQFLASGISYDKDEKLALLFHHDILKRRLTWSYRNIREL